jgi:hypothetical protein
MGSLIRLIWKPALPPVLPQKPPATACAVERVTTRITLPKSAHHKLQTFKQVSQRSQSDIVTELIRNA